LRFIDTIRPLMKTPSSFRTMVGFGSLITWRWGRVGWRPRLISLVGTIRDGAKSVLILKILIYLCMDDWRFVFSEYETILYLWRIETSYFLSGFSQTIIWATVARSSLAKVSLVVDRLLSVGCNLLIFSSKPMKLISLLAFSALEAYSRSCRFGSCNSDRLSATGKIESYKYDNCGYTWPPPP